MLDKTISKLDKIMNDTRMEVDKVSSHFLDKLEAIKKNTLQNADSKTTEKHDVETRQKVDEPSDDS